MSASAPVRSGTWSSVTVAPKLVIFATSPCVFVSVYSCTGVLSTFPNCTTVAAGALCSIAGVLCGVEQATTPITARTTRPYSLGIALDSNCIALNFSGPCEIRNSWGASTTIVSSPRRHCRWSSGVLGLLLVQAERGALRINRVHDAVTIGHVHRAVEDPAAVGLDALRRGVDVRNAEVDLPVRRHIGHLLRLVHHAADASARTVEDLVDAHLSHVHRVGRLPAERFLVEL